MAVICHKISVKCQWNHGETFTVKIYKLGPKCRWNILIVGDNTAAKVFAFKNDPAKRYNFKIKKKSWCKFLSKRAFSFSYLYVVNPLASHMSCLPLIKVDTHFPLYTHFSREWEPRKVSTSLSIKACFWGSRNVCNRWTLVTCESTVIEHPKFILIKKQEMCASQNTPVYINYQTV